MKKKLFFALMSIGIPSLLFGVRSKSVSVSADPGITGITINRAEFLTDSDGFDRMQFRLYNKEGIAISNVNTRDSNTSLTPTICFNGTDYTFGNVTQGTATLNGYVCMLSQEIPNDGSYWPIFFKHPSGQGDSGNASWYPTDYPGFPKDAETTIKFYPNTIIGQYKILNEFTLRVLRDQTGKVIDFNFIYCPHKIECADAKVSNTYTYNSKFCASLDSELIITPIAKTGYSVSGVSVKDSEQKSLEVTDKKDGTFSVIMPDKDINISVNYIETKYNLSFEGTDVTLQVKSGDLIGAIPEGNWAIDGFPISAKSFYLWNEDKTATRINSLKNEYKCECYVDGILYETVKFTDESTSLVLPAIPYKEGFAIVGWDLKGIEYKNLKTNAIYEAEI